MTQPKNKKSSLPITIKSRSVSIKKNNLNIDDIINKDKIYEEFIYKMEYNYFNSWKNRMISQKNLIINCKRCEICFSIEKKHDFILCDLCEDAYHTQCLNGKINNSCKDDRFYCPTCISENSEKLYSYDFLGKKYGKTIVKVSIS